MGALMTIILITVLVASCSMVVVVMWSSWFAWFCVVEQRASRRLGPGSVHAGCFASGFAMKLSSSGPTQTTRSASLMLISEGHGE